MISNLPPGAAVWSKQNEIPYGWTLTDLLITDLYQATTGVIHPARPTGKKSESARAKELTGKLNEQRARLDLK